MKTLVLSVVGVLMLLGVARQVEGARLIPHSYYRNMLWINRFHAHRAALLRVLTQRQQLRQEEARRARQGLPPSPEHLERARRLNLLEAHHREMMRAMRRATRS